MGLSTEKGATCTGANRPAPASDYNAKGRAMHLVACPVCGREFRKQGKTTGSSGVPDHQVAEVVR